MKTEQQNKLNDIMRDVEIKNKQNIEKIQSNSKEKDRFQQLKFNLPFTKNQIQQKGFSSTQVVNSPDITKKVDMISQQKFHSTLEKLKPHKNNEQDIQNTLLQKENLNLAQENKKLSNNLQNLSQKNSEIEEKMKERGKHVKDFLTIIQQKDQEIKDLKFALEKENELNKGGKETTVLKEEDKKNTGVKEVGGEVKLLEYVQFLENQYKKLETKYKKKQIDIQQLKQKLKISRQDEKMQIKELDKHKENDSNSNNNSDHIKQEKQQILELQQTINDLKQEINRLTQENSNFEKNKTINFVEKDNLIENLQEEIVQLKAQNWMKKYEQLELLHHQKLETLLSKSENQEKEITKANLEAKNEKEKRIRIEKSYKVLEIKLNNLNQELDKQAQNFNNLENQYEQSSNELQKLKRKQQNDEEKQNLVEQQIDEITKEKEILEQQLEQLTQKYNNQRDIYLEDLKKNKESQESLQLELEESSKIINEMNLNIQKQNKQIKLQEKNIKQQEIIIQGLKVDKDKIQQEYEILITKLKQIEQENIQLKNKEENMRLKFEQIIDDNNIKIKELTANQLEQMQKIQLYEQNYQSNDMKIKENLEQQINNNKRLQKQINEFQVQIEEQYEKYQNLKHQKELIQQENDENQLKIKQIIDQNQKFQLQKEEEIQTLSLNFNKKQLELQEKNNQNEQIFSDKQGQLNIIIDDLKNQNQDKQEKINSNLQLQNQLENQILNEQQKIQELQSNYNQLISQIQEYKNQIELLENKLNDSYQQYNVVKDMNDELRSNSDITIGQKIQEMSLLKVNLQSKCSENQELVSQIQKSQDILRLESENHQKIQLELQNQILKIQQDYQNLQQQIKEQTQQIQNQQSELELKENQIKQINKKQSEEFDTQQKTIEQMQQQNIKLIEEKQLLIKQRQLMQANFEHLENFQKELYEEKNQQEIQKNNLLEQLNKKEQQIELMHQEYTTLDEQSKQLNEQNQFLQSQLLTQLQEHKQIKEKLKEKENFSNKQENQINELSQQLKKTDQNIAQLQDTIAELKKQQFYKDEEIKKYLNQSQQDNQSILIDKQKEIIELNNLNQSLKNQIYELNQTIQNLEYQIKEFQKKEQEEDAQKLIQNLQEANDYLTSNLEQIMKEKKEQEDRTKEQEEKNHELLISLKALEELKVQSLEALQTRIKEEQEKFLEIQKIFSNFQSTIITNFQNLKNNKYTIDIGNALNFEQQEDRTGEIFVQQLNIMFKLVQKTLKEKDELIDSKFQIMKKIQNEEEYKEFDFGNSLSDIEAQNMNAFINDSGDPIPAQQLKQPQTLLDDNIQEKYLYDMHSLNEVQLRKELQQTIQKLSHIKLENEDLKKNLNSFHSQMQPNTYNILDNQKVWYELMETKAEMDHIKIVLEQYKEAVNEHEENEDRLSNKIKKLKDHISQLENAQKSPEFHQNEHQKKIFMKFFESYFEQGQDVDQLMIILCSLFNCSDVEKQKLTTGLQKIRDSLAKAQKQQTGLFKNIFK